MRLELPRMGHQVTVCPDGTAAAAALQRNTYDCILVDLDMPGLDGIGVIAKAKELSPDTEAIVLTGKGSMDTAVAALRHGAFDYLTKPCKLIDLESLLRRVAAKLELTNKYRALQQRLKRIEGSSELIGDSDVIEQVRRLITKVAPTNSTVLILGETGTGKELVARALHEQSLRAQMPFVPINCGALPENLIESELFGHRKGAFTGADQHRTGLFQVADGGTLFLDEIGELPKPMQAKLLRFLESGEIRRVGDNESFTCDVRVICATNCQLDRMVAAGRFRQDLWFRVNTFEITLPPLRERLEDVGLLARHLAARFGTAAARPGEEVFTPEALEALRKHTWPGTSSPPLHFAADTRRTFQAGPPVQPARTGDAGDRRGVGPSLRQQAQGRRRTGHQPEDPLQQAQPGGRAAQDSVRRPCLLSAMGTAGLRPGLGINICAHGQIGSSSAG